MTSLSMRSNALGFAISASLAGMFLPSAAAAAETVVIRHAEVESVRPATYGHAEIYDSKVTNHDVDGTRGWAAVGIDRGNLRIERTQVVTTGTQMGALDYYGGEYYNNGVVYDAVIERSDFTTSGDQAIGLNFGAITFNTGTGEANKVGRITVRDSKVLTTGMASHSMALAGVNDVDLIDSQLQTGGRDAVGIKMMGGILRMQGSHIETTGAAAHGIHARSMRWAIGGRPGTVYRGEVGLVDSSVAVHGAGSVGILAGYEDLGRADDIGALVKLHNASVRSAQSHAVQFLGGKQNTLALAAGSLLEGGDAVLFAGVADSVSRVTAIDSTLIGHGERAVVADNGAVITLQLDNSDVLVAPGKALAWAGNGSRISVAAVNSLLQGAAFADDASQLDVTLDGSRWDAWGQSEVDQLSLHSGSVLLLGAGTVGDQMTVRGDFAIADSTLVFDSTLGDDTSWSDRLWVQGDTSGQGRIVVNNVGGRGAQTVNGIQLIRVDGVSAADFKLDGRAVGGVYEYFLHKGSKGDPGDGGWYLRSELDPCSVDGACDPPPPRPVPCSVDGGQSHCAPEVVDPPPPRPVPCGVDAEQSHCRADVLDPPPPRPIPCGVDAGQAHCAPEVIVPPPVPVLRPEPGAYLANQVAATQMFALRASDRQPQARSGGSAGGPWASISGSKADYGVIGGQLRVDGNRSVLQVGTDVWAWGDEKRGRLGVFAGRGRADNTVTSVLTGYRATGKVEGQSLGVYAGWSQAPSSSTGLYLDASLQHARFHNSVRGEALAKERYDSRASSASIEAGYGIQLMARGNAALFVEPQLQLRYSRFAADTVTERNGTLINASQADGLGTRVGVRVFGHTTLAQANRVQPFVAVNWIRESSDNTLRFDGERLAGGLPKDRYEAKAVAQVQFGQRWNAWADMGWQRGGGYREVTGQIGLRASW